MEKAAVELRNLPLLSRRFGWYNLRVPSRLPYVDQYSLRHMTMASFSDFLGNVVVLVVFPNGRPILINPSSLQLKSGEKFWHVPRASGGSAGWMLTTSKEPQFSPATKMVALV